MQIWKYQLEPAATTQLRVPAPAKPIHVGIDANGYACVWFEVIEDQPTQAITLRRIGTGWKFSGGEHLGSYVEGPFVWHIYREAAQ